MDTEKITERVVRKIFGRFPSKSIDYNKVSDPEGFWKWKIDDVNRQAALRFNPKDVGGVIMWLNSAASSWDALKNNGSK